MKNMKKLIALTCVAAMLVPTLAYAEESNVQTEPSAITVQGDSVIENDNSAPYEYTSVVLPTTNSSTYKFQIDRKGLLDQYDSINDYESGATVLFHAEKTAATIAANTSSVAGKKLYTIGKDVDASANALFTAITGKTLTEAQAATQGKYFVWTPVKTDDNGPGQWTEIVFEAYTPAGASEQLPANYSNYIDLTIDDQNGDVIASPSLAVDPLSGEHIWDGEIYTIAYTEVTNGAKAVVDYEVEANEDGVITALEDGLYTSDDASTYTPVTTDNADTELVYTAAPVWYNSTSDKATVENKSTTAIAFSVDVTIEAEGLTFSQDGDYNGADDDDAADDDANASVYFTIKDENSNSKVIDEDGKGTAYYVLAGATNSYETFQGAANDPDAETGSHNYYKYETPNVTYTSQSFTVSATANTLTASDDAWAEYIADVEAGEVVRPTIKVVYNWVEVEKTDTANVYADETGVTYTTNGSNGWATATVAETTISGNAYSRSSTTNTYSITWASAMDDANKAIKALYLGSDGATYTHEIPAASYSLSGNTLTIDGVKNSVLGAGAVNNTRYIKVVFKDNSFAVITLTNITA